MYDKNVLSQSCVYKNKLVGLPIYTDYQVLYSNKILLSQYNKTVPKTWEELYNTAKYIVGEEKKKGNEIYGYNGLLQDNEVGVCSVYSFLFSYRNSVADAMPKITSKEAINGLKMIKKIKDGLASNDIFLSSLELGYELILTGKILFTNFFYYIFNNPYYEITAYPGVKEGISGSTIIGNNIAMGYTTDEERKNATIIAYSYLTSKELQKEFVINKYIFSSIPSIYQENEVCSKVNCNLYNSIQPFGRPTFNVDDYDAFSDHFRVNVFDYIFRNKSLNEVLRNIDDYTRVYYISLDTEETVIGLVSIIVVSVLTFFMTISLIFLYLKKYKPIFKFLTSDFWILEYLGNVIVLNNIWTEIGKRTTFLCDLNRILIIVGITCNIVPILHKLIISFPVQNNIIKWINDHKYIFISIFFLIDLMTCTIFLIPSYNLKKDKYDEDKIYETCIISSKYAKAILIFNIIVKIVNPQIIPK